MSINILNRISVSGIFGLLFLMNTIMISQDDINFSVKGEWTSGPCEMVDSNGNQVIINDGCKIEIMEFPSDTEKVLVTNFETRGFVYDGKLRDGKAFLGINGVGLSIVDVSDPANPHEISFLSIKGFYPVLELLWALALVGGCITSLLLVCHQILRCLIRICIH